MSTARLNKKVLYCLTALMIVVTAAGCGKPAAQTQPPLQVKVMPVIQKDTPVTYEYVGQIEAKNEVQIRSKVSGNIIAKMVTGGNAVTEGQPLFQIDRRQYEADVLSAQAQLAQAEAVLANSRLDLSRYQKLASQQAIAQQALDNSLAIVQQNEAQVAAYRAKLQQAENNLADTLIVSPVSGRIDVNTLSVGAFVTSGSTLLATVSSIDPALVKFSMSENEYLRFVRMGNNSPTEWGQNLKLVLSDGSEYPVTGQIEQVDRGLSSDTGTLSLKAAFTNPQGLLVPGMFARICAQGELRKGALLVPERAVQQMLGKTFITIVGAENKAESRPVKMGPRVGNMWVVEEGLNVGDQVVVEGFAKAQPGMPLSVTVISENDLQISAKQ